MKEFIEIKRKCWACCDKIPFQYDVIRVDSIINIYIGQPEGKEIHILHMQNGKLYHRKEMYKTPEICKQRYENILKYMDIGRNNIMEGTFADPDLEDE